ncbi:hypothetical protein TNCV_4375851 [Trichonephila clavipes]|uniref:Uncharacterized protein n=1 Tax=Trichonephila clavipes TaxID=2585209 RepID=A0A8X7BDN9_TRICX|nr:hypothetical protein TNCV_4375851 [Trichonephila clavipes]
MYSTVEPGRLGLVSSKFSHALASENKVKTSGESSSPEWSRRNLIGGTNVERGRDSVVPADRVEVEENESWSFPTIP